MSIAAAAQGAKHGELHGSCRDGCAVPLRETLQGLRLERCLLGP